MSPKPRSWFESLGLLRSALLLLALVNMLLPIVDAQLGGAVAAADERSLWDLFASLISPVMAPLFVVVILFDYIMSRVRAADASGDEQARFTRVARIELAVILITLAYWIPALVALTR